jgi:hypothetical protein
MNRCHLRLSRTLSTNCNVALRRVGVSGNFRKNHSADREAGALPSIAGTATDLEILRVTAATHRNRNDVIELKLRLRAAVPTTAAVPEPHKLLDIIGDHVPPPGLVLRRPVHRNHGSSTVDATALVPLPWDEQGVHLVSLEVVGLPIKAVLKLPIPPPIDLRKPERKLLLKRLEFARLLGTLP